MTDSMRAVGFRENLPADDPSSLVDLKMPIPAPGPHDLVDIRFQVRGNVEVVHRHAEYDHVGGEKLLDQFL